MTDDKSAARIQRLLKEKRKNEANIILTGHTREREWQCAECGHVQTTQTRPKSCPDCNFVNGDMPPGVNLYAPREAIGWFE